MDPSAENYYSCSPYSYGFNNPIRFIDPDGADGWDSLMGGLIGLGTNIIPRLSFVRDYYNPRSSRDYNDALRRVDNAAMATGAAMVVTGGGMTGGGGAMVGTGLVVAGTGVGVPEGAAIAGTGIVVVTTAEATILGGAYLMANASNNSKEGYNRGKDKNNVSSGNKNSQHANQKAKEVAAEKYKEAKAEYDALKSKPNKTKQDKKDLSTLEKRVDHLKDKMDETGENHSQRHKGNR